MSDWPIPDPIDPINAEFWHVLQEGVLRFQRCTDCGRYRHLPRYMCSDCGSTEYEWSPVSGEGELYSWTVTHQVFHPRFEVPFIAAVVEFPEGVRMMSQLVGVDPEQLHLGMKVGVEFKEITEEFKTPVYRAVN